MLATSETSETRDYLIEDGGDGFDLALFVGEVQVCGAWLPDQGDGGAFDLARQIGEAWRSAA